MFILNRSFYSKKRIFCRPFLIKNGPLTTEISGIDCEELDITKAKLLYAKVVDGKGHLLALSQKIVAYFVERGERNLNLFHFKTPYLILFTINKL